MTDSFGSIPSHPVIFNQLDGQVNPSAALQTDGSAGPSALDSAVNWHSMCTMYHGASKQLRSSLAGVARSLGSAIRGALSDVLTHQRERQQTCVSCLLSTLPPPTLRSFDLAKESGSSADHGFSLAKADFRDALCLQYG